METKYSRRRIQMKYWSSKSGHLTTGHSFLIFKMSQVHCCALCTYDILLLTYKLRPHAPYPSHLNMYMYIHATPTLPEREGKHRWPEWGAGSAGPLAPPPSQKSLIGSQMSSASRTWRRQSVVWPRLLCCGRCCREMSTSWNTALESAVREGNHDYQCFI